LRDAASTDNLTMDRYDLMRGIQQDAQPVERTLLPNQAPALPATRAGTGAAPAAAPTATPSAATATR
jgi:general secretion pathway protein D